MLAGIVPSEAPACAKQHIGSVTGFFTPFDHLEGGFLYVRETALAVDARIVALRPAGLAVRPLSMR